MKIESSLNRQIVPTSAMIVFAIVMGFGTRMAYSQEPSCEPDDLNAGCIAGCEDCADVKPGCSGTVNGPGLTDAQNFFPVDLALVQSPEKINRFQEGCHDALLGKGVPAGKIKAITNIADAIAEIDAESTAQGNPIKVFICGHGSPGNIKVGNDPLSNAANLANFINGIDGKVSSLVLFGCSVAKEQAGINLINKLANDLEVPVKAWTGTVYAYPDDEIYPESLRGKLWHEDEKVVGPIPAASEWGLAALVLLLLSAATIMISRRREAVA